MREIKFRAWDKKYKDMVEAASLSDLIVSGTPKYITDDYIWMQFTGLFDKNGKEIYEGDINDTDDELMYVVYDDENACFGLKYVDPVTLPDDYIETSINWGNLNIVGNIYDKGNSDG